MPRSGYRSQVTPYSPDMTTRRALDSPAVQRGLASIVAAILILAFPDLTTKSLFLLASVGALVFGAIELVDCRPPGRSLAGHIPSHSPTSAARARAEPSASRCDAVGSGPTVVVRST